MIIDPLTKQEVFIVISGGRTLTYRGLIGISDDLWIESIDKPGAEICALFGITSSYLKENKAFILRMVDKPKIITVKPMALNLGQLLSDSFFWPAMNLLSITEADLRKWASQAMEKTHGALFVEL